MSQLTRLFEPAQIGSWSLRSRTAMAPMTRCFADDQTGEVNVAIAEYYRKRAQDGIGLIITEGTLISARGKGNPGVPGIFTSQQVESWKEVTDAVHKEGGTIICQLWHVGRLSHRDLLGGLLPQAPSAIAAQGRVPRTDKLYDTPEEMTQADINELINQYVVAARNALRAGFDGVEIHAAHGYLIDQFIAETSNHRTDRYGGDLKQRLTLLKEVTDAVIKEVGADRTLIRFSEFKGDQHDYRWEDPVKTIQAYVEAFKEVGATMLHPSTMQFTRKMAEGKTMHELVRQYWDGVIVGVGDLDPQTAEQALEAGVIDVAAFGRPLISNPDYLTKVRHHEPLVEYDAEVHLPVLI